MRSPRSVTLQPMGMPSRSLKPAIEFFARVITGRWPAMMASCSAASSSALALVLASPTPMFRVILVIRGTAVVGEPVADPRRLAAGGADQLHVGQVQRRLLLDHAAGDHLLVARVARRRPRLGVPLDHVDLLDHDAAALRQHAHDGAALARILAGV